MEKGKKKLGSLGRKRRHAKRMEQGSGISCKSSSESKRRREEETGRGGEGNGVLLERAGCGGGGGGGGEDLSVERRETTRCLVGCAFSNAGPRQENSVLFLQARPSIDYKVSGY